MDQNLHQEQEAAGIDPDAYCKLKGSTSYDPDKVWLIIHYPDCLSVSADTLKGLLKALSQDHTEYCMDQLEWTLCARVNCKNDVQESTSKTDTVRPSVESLQRDETTPESATPFDTAQVPAMKLVPDPDSEYFSVTAKVHNPTNDCVSADDPHCILEDTPTIVVDMRYKFTTNFSCCVKEKEPNMCVWLKREDVAENIAAMVRTIVTDHLVGKAADDKTKNVKVYVLKPEIQRSRGVSPQSSHGSDKAIDDIYPEGFDPFNDVDQGPTPTKKAKLTEE